MSDIRIRAGSVDDLAVIMWLFDESVVWLVERGRSAQWGSDPWSTDERKTSFIRNMLIEGDTLIATIDDLIVGAANFGTERIAYAPEIDEPEIYVHLLITSPSVRGRGVGTLLLDQIRTSTVKRGIGLLRVDCWSGGDRKLVSYYEGQGFRPTVEVTVRDNTTVQVFEQRLDLGPR